MNLKRRLRHVFVVLAAVLLLSGCGGTNTEDIKPVQTIEAVGVHDDDSAAGNDRTNDADSADVADVAALSSSDSAAAGESIGNGDAWSEDILSPAGDGATDNGAGNNEKADTDSLSLVMVGDVLLHTPVAKGAVKEDGSYDFHHLFANIQEEIQAADIKVVNQEVILGGAELGVSGYPAFNAPFELGDALLDTGFNVVLHATNHTVDKGKKGLVNCMNYWQEHPEMTVLGIHDSEESRNHITVWEQNGMKIALLNYTYGTNGISLPSDMPFAVDLLEEKRVIADLQAAEELADFTIVFPHWGTEYTLTQTQNQKKWAKLFAENGADLVIATHPHVIEPIVWWEKVDGKWNEVSEEPEINAEGRMLVYYSLGNFVNWTSGTGSGVANRMVGGMAQVTLSKDADQVYISKWGVEPLVSHVEKGFGAVTVYPLKEYTAELGQRNEIRSQDSNFSYEYCLKLVKEVFGLDMSETNEE